MRSTIVVDGRELKLNRFISELNANLIDAIARSLKFTEGENIRIHWKEEQIRLFVDDREVSLELGHAQQIVKGVLLGLLQNLHGAADAKDVQFLCDRT